MAQVVIELLREAPFLKGGTVFRGADMDDPNIGNIQLESEPFLGKVIGVRTERPHFSGGNGKWMWDEEFLPLEEFKKLVPRCAIMGDNKKIINYDDINIYNMDDNFFTDEKFTAVLAGGKCVLDTEQPHHRIMAAMFLVDNRFVRIVGDEMPNYGDEIYSIGLAENVDKARVQNAQVAMDVAATLQNIDRANLLILAKVWNKFPSNKVSDKAIRAELYDHISKQVDGVDKKSRGNFFLRFASMSNEKKKLFNTFMDGVRARLITRSFDTDMYIFNNRELGRDEEESVEFLSFHSNESLLKDLVTGIKLKSPKKLKEAEVVFGESYQVPSGNEASNTAPSGNEPTNT